MRIGEILLHHKWVEWEPFALAITDHAASGKRFVSYLVARGEVDFDDASRALAEQHGVSAALRRHLERRDEAAAKLIPAIVARRLVAVPLGRVSNGTLVICVRDPSDEVLAELAREVEGEIALAVAPATYVERIVRVAYPPGASGEFDIPLEVDEPEHVLEPDAEDDADIDLPIDIEMPPEKPARPKSKALPVQFKAKPKGTATPARDSLDATIAALKDIDELPWMLDVVMEYVAKRWQSSLLVELRERRAVGVRGHGAKLKPAAIKTFVIDLDEPSVVASARNERRIIESEPDLESEPSENDAAISTALGAYAVVAAPITRGDTVAYVLAVGDPVGKDREETPIDLSLLIEAVSDALARM